MTLCIPDIIMVTALVAAAVYPRRFYVRTVIFMENAVKRVKGAKRVTTVLVKKGDVISGEENDYLI